MILVFGSRPPKDKPDMTQRYALDVRNVLDPVLDATPPTVLLEGGAKGPDLWARHLASRADRVAAGWAGQSEEVTDQEWKTLGRAAGPRRNARMAEILAEQNGARNRLAVGFWDGESTGTKSMIAELYRVGVAPFVFHVSEDYRVTWPVEWRGVEFTGKDGQALRLVIAGADVQSARVVLSPFPDLLTMHWPVLYKNRDAAGWTFVKVEPYQGWPTVPLSTATGAA